MLDTPNMKMNVMKQYASAFDDPKLASGGDGVNGIALPPGDVLLGTGNGSAGAVASTVCIIISCCLYAIVLVYF